MADTATARKHVFILAHPQFILEQDISDPGLTKKEKSEIREIISSLPRKPSNLVIGTGRRHRETAAEINRSGTRITRVTDLAGNPACLRKLESGKLVMQLPSFQVERDLYTTPRDLSTLAYSMIVSLPHDSIVCGGPAIVSMIGADKSDQAEVYKVAVSDGEIKNIEIVSNRAG